MRISPDFVFSVENLIADNNPFVKEKTQVRGALAIKSTRCCMRLNPLGLYYPPLAALQMRIVLNTPSACSGVVCLLIIMIDNEIALWLIDRSYNFENNPSGRRKANEQWRARTEYRFYS